MVAPLLPVSDKETEARSSSSDACETVSLRENGAEAFRLPVQDCSLTLHDAHSQGSSAVSNVENLACAHNCVSLSNEQTSVLDASVQYPVMDSHVCNRHVHSSSLEEASSIVIHAPNSNHVSDSTSRASFIPMEGPPTGVMSICGMRPEMEDTVTVAHRFLVLPCRQIGGCSGACRSRVDEQDTEQPVHFFGVYDGHGGSQVSNFCKERLHITLAKEVECNRGAHDQGDLASHIPWEKSWEKAMSLTFHKVDAEIEGVVWKSVLEDNGSVRERISAPIAPETVGSTAVVAVIGLCQIIVANCGDSRAVLSRGGQAIPLSVDHKPNREDEMERIEAAGGRVIHWNGYRVFGVLAMSRAIGDRYLKPYVIAEPEVTCISRSHDDDCLILASDGLWDVMNNEEVCEVARRCLKRRQVTSDGSRCPGFMTGSTDKNAEAAATLLTKMALAQGSHDNISVVVVDLKDGRQI